MQFCVSVVQFERLSLILSAIHRNSNFVYAVAVGSGEQHGNFSDICMYECILGSVDRTKGDIHFSVA